MAYDAQWLYQTIKTDPQGSEAKSLGDDAIREIKVVLQNMFKGSFDSGTTDQYTGTLSQLNDIVSNGAFPRNSIIAWAPEAQESPEDGPDGWTVCDGRNRKDGLGGSAPDLRARFIVGSKVNDDPSTTVPIPGFPGSRPLYEPPNVGIYGGQQEYNMYYSTSNQNIVQLPTTTEFVQSNTGGIGGTGTRAHNHLSELYSPDEVRAGNNVPPFFSAIFIIKD